MATPTSGSREINNNKNVPPRRKNKLALPGASQQQKKKQKSEDDSRRVNAPDRLYVLSIYRHMTEAAKSMSVDKTIELSSW